MKNKNYIRYSIIAMTVISMTITTLPAQINTLYHMETVSTRHEMNPSFQPGPKGYFSTIPIFSGFYLGAGDNSLSLDDILLPKGSDGRAHSTWFYNDEKALNDLYKTLKKNTHIYTETDFRLLAFGMRILDSAYITIGLDTKANVSVFVPKDMAKLLLYGTTDTDGINSFNLERFGARANVYTELAMGYSQKILPKLTVGGKLKLLFGHANIKSKIDKFTLNASREHWDFDIKGTIETSIPGGKYKIGDKDELKGIDIETDQIVGNIMGGFGLAIDLGANYKLLDDKLTVSASLLDFGFIKWKAANSSRISADGHFEFDGIEFEFEDGVAKWDDSYFDDIEEKINYKPVNNVSYTSTLAAKILLGAEYRILDDKLACGALSKSTIVNKSVLQEITASANYIQFKFFNASLSYSLLQGKFSSFGLGLGGRLGPVNMYLAGDYFPSKYSAQYIPYKNKAFNLQMGILFNFGYKTAKAKTTKVTEQ
jgi:hypothetical protein